MSNLTPSYPLRGHKPTLPPRGEGERKMINPRMVRTWSERFNDRARGTKFYRAGFEMPGHAKFSLAKFRTKTDAEEYAVKVILRWMRLYDAALVEVAA